MSEILDLLRRRLVFIVVCGLIAAGVPAALATTSPDSYRATARLFVATAAQDVTAANQGNLAAQSRVRSYALLAVGPELLTRAAQRSGVAISEADLAKRISVSTPPDTVLLDIAATAGTPQEAAALSDAVSQELVTLVSQAERPLRGGSPSLGLLILQPADAGVAKVPAVVPTQLALFGVAGLVVGAVIAILIPGRVRLRRRKRPDVEKSDAVAAASTETDGAETVTAAPRTATQEAAPIAPQDAAPSPSEDVTTAPTPDPVPPPRRVPGRDDRHPNWTTFDTLDTGRRPVGPSSTNGHGRAQQPPTQRASPRSQDGPVDRRGWEDLTDPTGSLRPITNGTEPTAPRRHRRESGGWQYSPAHADGAHRPGGRGDESP